MNTKRPVDVKRESGGFFDLGSEEDGPIVEAFPLGNALLIVRTKTIYEVRMADAIDPARENPDLPLVVPRRVFHLGSESELVCRVFLTAERLFKNTVPSIDMKQALLFAFDALIEMGAMQNAWSDYKAALQKVTDEYNALVESKTSYAIPSISDVLTRCTTFFQKADHATHILMQIIMCFFPEAKLNPQSHFSTLHTFAQKQYGDDNDFTKFLAEVLPILKLIRASRNALDHRLATITIKDFEIQKDGNILPPTFEINHQGIKEDRTELDIIMTDLLESMVTIFEIMIAYACEVKATDGLIHYQVKLIPEKQRRNKYIRYCYWSPIGEGGFYNQ